MQLPADPAFETNTDIAHAREDLGRVAGEWYGEAQVWFPYTREGALSLLQEFVRERLHNFGPYEDAIESDHARLFHSTLSPVLNIGLITPREVIDAALHEATRTSVPLASLEGFIRQVLGWREFIRAAYERDGRVMRSQNFWKHTRTLSEAHWNGTTGIPPFDQMVHKALRYGYAHHIERLMVAGNLMLLSEIHPHEVYRWFMALFIDAYDWVMVPNVYGMSQFADGGSFATKPYISGSNYLKKMGTFEKGAWEETWDGLYWHFIEKHTDYFASQHRLSMMPKLLAKMDADRRNVLMRSAQQFLSRG
jgi:deoxyribodipyrimidine photolyase-related protein